MARERHSPFFSREGTQNGQGETHPFLLQRGDSARERLHPFFSREGTHRPGRDTLLSNPEWGLNDQGETSSFLLQRGDSMARDRHSPFLDSL